MTFAFPYRYHRARSAGALHSRVRALVWDTTTLFVADRVKASLDDGVLQVLRSDLWGDV